MEKIALIINSLSSGGGERVVATLSQGFAKNYDVSWVPVPISNPLGKVDAGMMTFAKYAPIEASRYAYPNIASWPDNLFLLDRGFILMRFF